MPQFQRICFDRVVPSTYNPARDTTHRIAAANYVFAVRQKSATLAMSPPPDAPLSQHVNAIQQLGMLNANDPVTVARMAVINLKKWDNGRTPFLVRLTSGTKTTSITIFYKSTRRTG
jgi:hypothetical protein